MSKNKEWWQQSDEELRAERVLGQLRHVISAIENSSWIETKLQWGDRAEWGTADNRRDEVLRDLKSVYHTLGGPKL